MPAAAHPQEADQPSRRTIGDLLRETRQSFGGQIDQIAATLRIRASYLTAIEESRYDRLPAAVYALGFVRAYANHLGLDAEEAVRRFKQETASFEMPRGLSFPVPLAERSVPGGTMILAALILALCGYGLWYYVSTGERERPERVSVVPPDLKAAAQPQASAAATPSDGAAAPSPTTPGDAAAGTVPAAPAPAAADTPATAVAAVPPPVAAANPAAAPSPAPAAIPSPAPVAPVAAAPAPPSAAGAVSPPVAALLAPNASPVAPAAPPAAAPSSTNVAALPPNAPRVFGAGTDEPSRILITARKDAWIQVRDLNNHIVSERTLRIGDAYRVPDRPGLSLRTGNGAGLDIAVDGKPVPAIGGTVRHNVTLDPGRLLAGTAIVE